MPRGESFRARETMTKTNARFRLQGVRGAGLSVISKKKSEATDEVRGEAEVDPQTMLAETAHDLNNALGSIRLHLDLLELESGDAGRVRQRVEEIRPAVDYAAEMARQLLSPELGPQCSRGPAGESDRQSDRESALGSAGQFAQGSVPVRAIDLNPVLERMAPLLSVILPKEVELSLSLGPGLDPVSLESSDLIRIVSNLVLNSSAALERRSRVGKARVTIRTEQMESRNSVRLQVSDTGGGMSAKTKARIFQPFFSVSNRRKGFGLGLSSVLRMVRRAGGSIEVESKLGKGTDVTIELPCRSMARKEPQGSGPPADIDTREISLPKPALLKRG